MKVNKKVSDEIKKDIIIQDMHDNTLPGIILTKSRR